MIVEDNMDEYTVLELKRNKLQVLAKRKMPAWAAIKDYAVCSQAATFDKHGRRVNVWRLIRNDPDSIPVLELRRLKIVI